ncbi:MAG: hypothetical protein LUE93_13370 [Bacteroides sp.]|nr:hypothetical protein [Bacteroides sp.]
MTEEQFIKLQKYESILLAAFRKKFFRYPDTQTKSELQRIYDEITGRKNSFSQGCSACSGICWIERLAKWYNEYKTKHTIK